MATNFSVYVGLWRDYSESGLNQVILTLPLRWGNVLVSFLALVVSFAGTATWKIVAYALHQARVRQATRNDPLQQQVQALLRNRTTPVSALSDAFWITLAWAQSPHPALRTLLPTALLAGLITVAFAVFSIFVSAVATSGESNVNVLARPGQNCGGWDFNWTVTNVLDNSVPNKIEFLRARVDDTVAARSYATWFYSRDKKPLAATSTVFPISQLPYETSMGPCPFLGQGRCLSNDTATPNPTLILDTGLLDSHVHLGINAPSRDRSNLRLRMECSPIAISDVYRPLGEQDGYSSFDFAGFMNMSRSTVVLPTKRELLNVGYSTGSVFILLLPRPLLIIRTQMPLVGWCNESSSVAGQTVEQPGPGHQRLRCVAELHPVRVTSLRPAVSRNREEYHIPIRVWRQSFQRNRMYPAGAVLQPSDGRLHQPHSRRESFQRVGVQPGLQCVSGYGHQAIGSVAGAYRYKHSRSGHIGRIGTACSGGCLWRNAFFPPPAGSGVSLLGSCGVAWVADKNEQWQREVQLWFETKLALLQAHVVRFLDRIDLSSPFYTNTLIYRPYDSMPKGAERDAVYAGCQNQRIATTGQYQNFKFWAVALIVIVCAAILALGVALDPAMRFIRQKWWRTEEGDAKQRARDRDGLYWLLRLALEGQGVGPWRMGGRKADSEIPVVDGFYKGEEMISTPSKESG